jgi:LPS-assembly protein
VSCAAHRLAALTCAALLGLGYAPASWSQGQIQKLPVLDPLVVPATVPETGLKSSPMLAEKPPQGPGNEVPTFVYGDNISGRPDLETVIEGNAELRRGPTAVRADRIEYFQPDDSVKTLGNVHVSNAGNQYYGSELQIKLDTFEGFFSNTTYRFLSNAGNGRADRINFIDDQRLVAIKASYTTCERTDEASWKPAWVLTADSFKFDMEAETGEATGAVLRFKDVPILAFPTVSFPLSDKRKSGLLPPTIGVDSISGVQVTQPYYFNIAPNRDATFSPTILSKRGIDLGGEYRYLENDFNGKIAGNYLPGDKLRGIDRWSYSLQHLQTLRSDIPGVGNFGLNLNLNRVSDNEYWRDFTRNGDTLTQRLLANDASLTWGKGFLSTSVRVLKWQTLQDLASPITPPYDLLPQATATYTRVNVPIAGMSGFDWSTTAQYSQFSIDRTQFAPPNSQPNGERGLLSAQISRPWISPSAFITPKLQLHATSYRYDSPFPTTGNSADSRVVPTFSLDSGLQFERPADFFGRSFTQTLEPRAFYVRTPFRDQSGLPNYDSGANDFNFATVFTENAFAGNDRISDANLLTLGATTRLLNPDTGAETARFGVAQRLRFEDQLVTLPGFLPVTDRISDLLVGTTINWTPQWTFDSTVQYNPKTKKSERSTFGLRYSPGDYRVVSAALRRQVDQNNLAAQSNLVDVGWQWPINDLWGDKGQNLGAGRGQGEGRYYSVGRMNYSVPDKKFVDLVLGVEYDGCCWIGRVVFQRSQSSLATSNSRILFQLELVGFSRIGSNPLEALKTNIPRYQLLRDKVAAPSRFTNYD